MKIPPANNTSYIPHIKCLLDEYPNHTLCLSDGSKSKYKSAYAYSIDSSPISYHIRNMASVFTAELMVIFSCLSQLTQLPPHCRFLLLTDSLSSLQSLSNPCSTNPSIQRIYLTLHSLHSVGSQITIIGIPGHIGFPKHDAVDKAAKQATFFPKNHYHTLILQSWNLFWKTQPPNKLLLIKQIPSPWYFSNRDSKREEIILTCSRIGHSRVTHSCLLNRLSYLLLHALTTTKKINQLPIFLLLP